MSTLIYISYKDIGPIKPETNRVKFIDGIAMDHPDSENRNRYVLGTRFTAKTGQSKSGHKRDTCAYHDLDLSEQGKDVKSMIQEAMQLVRDGFNKLKFWNSTNKAS